MEKFNWRGYDEAIKRNNDYLTLEDATRLKEEHGGSYTDVRFEGVVRILATADSYIDFYDDHARDGEREEEFQIRMKLEEALDVDLRGDDYRKPYWRPVEVKTEIKGER